VHKHFLYRVKDERPRGISQDFLRRQYKTEAVTVKGMTNPQISTKQSQQQNMYKLGC